jgi:ribosome-associated toxin RatA of RatAB toxin-antitoxin module
MTLVLPWRFQRNFALLLLLSCAALLASAADAMLVQARRQGDAVQVQAQATVRAPHALIWKTLTDYEHMAEFVPGIRSSRVLERHGTTTTVEQVGTARLWFFSFTIDVVVEATEQPPYLIGIRVLKGNLKQLNGGYRLEKIDGSDDEFLLRWEGVIEPDIPVPQVIAVPLLRASLAEQFGGMVKEIERREALRVQGKAG